MNKIEAKHIRRTRRKASVRKRVLGTPDRPRMCVNRSLKHIYVQVIDDLNGRTLASASTRESGAEAASTGSVSGAAAVGKAIASRVKEKGIEQVVFDRNWHKFHGRVKALADAAREEGLKF
ncbi:MAG: 50S ribosomal protein L18 [Planctomycetota bacterium]|jgi:large subunit ribosomal protein L18